MAVFDFIDICSCGDVGLQRQRGNESIQKMSDIETRRSAQMLPSEAHSKDTRDECASAAPAQASGAVVLSYYRRYALECRIAANHAASEKQRSELQKMIAAWSDFAMEHERMIREPAAGCPGAVRRRPVKAWM
jgi:hypothetical protein